MGRCYQISQGLAPGIGGHMRPPEVFGGTAHGDEARPLAVLVAAEVQLFSTIVVAVPSRPQSAVGAGGDGGESCCRSSVPERSVTGGTRWTATRPPKCRVQSPNAADMGETLKRPFSVSMVRLVAVDPPRARVRPWGAPAR